MYQTVQEHFTKDKVTLHAYHVIKGVLSVRCPQLIALNVEDQILQLTTFYNLILTLALPAVLLIILSSTTINVKSAHLVMETGTKQTQKLHAHKIVIQIVLHASEDYKANV